MLAQPVRTTITDDGTNVTVQTPVNVKVIPICDFHWVFVDGQLRLWIEGRNELIPGGRLGNFTINGTTTQQAKLDALGAISAQCAGGGAGSTPNAAQIPLAEPISFGGVEADTVQEALEVIDARLDTAMNAQPEGQLAYGDASGTGLTSTNRLRYFEVPISDFQALEISNGDEAPINATYKKPLPYLLLSTYFDSRHDDIVNFGGRYTGDGIQERGTAFIRVPEIGGVRGHNLVFDHFGRLGINSDYPFTSNLSDSITAMLDIQGENNMPLLKAYNTTGLLKINLENSGEFALADSAFYYNSATNRFGFNSKYWTGVANPIGAVTPKLLVGGGAVIEGNLNIQNIGSLSQITVGRWNGTKVAPTAIISGNNMFALNLLGYTGSAWAGNTPMRMYAQGNWTSTSQGYVLNFKTTRSGYTFTTGGDITLQDDGRFGVNHGFAPPAWGYFKGYNSGYPLLQVADSTGQVGIELSYSRWLKINKYGVGVMEAIDLLKTQSEYIAGFATDGTITEIRMPNGIYTPTITKNTATDTIVTIYTAMYSRNDSIVSISGQILLNTEAATTTSSLQLSLPPGITSNFTDADNDISGTVTTRTKASAPVTTAAWATTDTSTEKIVINWVADAGIGVQQFIYFNLKFIVK